MSLNLGGQTLIFHSARPLGRSPSSGSAVRPIRMLEAFRDLGLNVVCIDGPSWERKKSWRVVQNTEPDQFLGVYSEWSVPPIALTDPDHVPRHPFMDLANMSALKKRGVPVSLFYRDVFWRFPEYAQEYSWPLPFLGRIVHQVEYLHIIRSVSHLFLPSLGMLSAMPPVGDSVSVSALPPGCITAFPTVSANSGRSDDRTKRLNMFYVGGVTPPNYDLTEMFSVVASNPQVNLCVCCRQPEWAAVSARSIYSVGPNVQIVHAEGDELSQYYEKADVLLMFRATSEYLRFAVPVKLFEAVGMGVPVIVRSGTLMSELVENYGLGWSVSDTIGLSRLISELAKNPKCIVEKRKSVVNARQSHSWRSRALQVVDRLTELRERPVGAKS